MIHILPFISGFIMIFGGGYLVLLGFKIINPKKKDPIAQEKMIIWHKKFGGFAKICGIILLILGALNLIYPEFSSLDIKKESATKNWTQDQKDQLMHQVINGSKYLKSLNPDSANIVARCFVDKYTEKFTLDDAWKQDKMRQDQILELTLPLMNECLKQLGLKK
jgi:hypothetical protein